LTIFLKQKKKFKTKISSNTTQFFKCKMMWCEKPMGSAPINCGLPWLGGPLFWFLTHQTCCLPHGWTRGLKWTLMGITTYCGIGGEFLNPPSCGVHNH
jgi:hypothetical protein